MTLAAAMHENSKKVERLHVQVQGCKILFSCNQGMFAFGRALTASRPGVLIITSLDKNFSQVHSVEL